MALPTAAPTTAVEDETTEWQRLSHYCYYLNYPPVVWTQCHPRCEDDELPKVIIAALERRVRVLPFTLPIHSLSTIAHYKPQYTITAALTGPPPTLNAEHPALPARAHSVLPERRALVILQSVRG
jgi:hypothetical protein